MADDEKTKNDAQNGAQGNSGQTTQQKAEGSGKAPKNDALIPGGDARNYAELFLFSEAMRDISTDGPVMSSLRRRSNLSQEDFDLLNGFNGGAVEVSKFMKLISRFYDEFGFKRPVSEADLRKYYVYGKSIAVKNGKIPTKEEVNRARIEYEDRKEETAENAKNKTAEAEKGYKVAKSAKTVANWKTRLNMLGIFGSALLALSIPGAVLGGVVAVATVPAISIGWMTGGGIAILAGSVIALRYVFPKCLKLFGKAIESFKKSWEERKKAKQAKKDAKKVLKKERAELRSITSQMNMDKWYEQYSQKYPGLDLGANREKTQETLETIRNHQQSAQAENVSAQNAPEQTQIVVPSGASNEVQETAPEYLKEYSPEEQKLFAEFEDYAKESYSDNLDENLAQFVTEKKLKDESFDSEAFKQKYKEMQTKKKAFESKKESEPVADSEKAKGEEDVELENAPMTKDEQESFFKRFEVSRIQNGKNKEPASKEEIFAFAKQELQKPNLSQNDATELYKDYQTFAIDRAERDSDKSTEIKFDSEGRIEYVGEAKTRVDGILESYDESKIPDTAKDSREAFVAYAQEHGASELEAELLYQERKEQIDQVVVVKNQDTGAGESAGDTADTTGDSTIVEEIAKHVENKAQVVAENIASVVADGTEEKKEEKKTTEEKVKKDPAKTAVKDPAKPENKPAKAESKHNCPWLAINCFESIEGAPSQAQIDAIFAKTGYKSVEDARVAYAKTKKIEPSAVNVFPQEGKKPNRPWLAKTIAETVGADKLSENYAKLTGYTDPQKASFDYAKTQFRKASKETLQKLAVSSWKEFSAKSTEDVVKLWNDLDYSSKTNLMASLDGLSLEEVDKLTDSMPNGIKQFVRTGVRVRSRKVSAENAEEKENPVKTEPKREESVKPVKTEPKKEEPVKPEKKEPEKKEPEKKTPETTEKKEPVAKPEKKEDDEVVLYSSNPEDMYILFDRYHEYLVENGMDWKETGQDKFLEFLIDKQGQPEKLAQRLWGFYKGYEYNLEYEAEKTKEAEEKKPEAEKEPEIKPEEKVEEKSEPASEFSEKEITVYGIYEKATKAIKNMEFDQEEFVRFAIGQGVSAERANKVFEAMANGKQVEKTEKAPETKPAEKEFGLEDVLKTMHPDEVSMFRIYGIEPEHQKLLEELDKNIKIVKNGNYPNKEEFIYNMVRKFYQTHVNKTKDEDEELGRE